MKRTPEEIKKGLECCASLDGDQTTCMQCPYEVLCRELREKMNICPGSTLMADALDYIKQLEEGIDRVYELAKGLRLQISQIESQLAAPYKQATMKEVAEHLKSMGINCCYGEDEHGI